MGLLYTIGAIKGDTRSLDYGSFSPGLRRMAPLWLGASQVEERGGLRV